MTTLLSEHAVVRRGAATPCDWCRETINPGDPYVRSGCATDGAAYTLRMHIECHCAAGDTPDPHGDGVSMGEGRRGVALDEDGEEFGDPADRLRRGMEWWRNERKRHAITTASIKAAGVLRRYAEGCDAD